MLGRGLLFALMLSISTSAGVVSKEVDTIEVAKVEDLFSDEGIIKTVEISKRNREIVGNFELKENEQVVEVVEEIEPTLPEFSVFDVDEYIIYSTSSLNLRSGGAKDYAKVGSVVKGAELVVTGETDTGWLRVKYNSDIAYCSAKYTSTEKPVVEVIAESPSSGVVDTSPYNNVWFGEGSSTGSVCAKANEYWNKNVPESIKQKLVDSGWRFIISEQALNSRFGYSYSVAGITEYASKCVYLDNRSRVVSNAMIHELGHAIASENGRVDLSDTFIDIYNRESANFRDCTSAGDGHETLSSTEYFASVFQNSIINASNCASQVPESYAFVCQYW